MLQNGDSSLKWCLKPEASKVWYLHPLGWTADTILYSTVFYSTLLYYTIGPPPRLYEAPQAARRRQGHGAAGSQGLCLASELHAAGTDMYTYMYINRHTYAKMIKYKKLHAYKYTYICIGHRHLHMHLQMHLRVLQTHKLMHRHNHIHMHMHIHVQIHIQMHIHMHVICAYTTANLNTSANTCAYAYAYTYTVHKQIYIHI